MFADPQSVVIGGTTNSLPRVGSGLGQGAFQLPDSSVSLSISHSYGKRTRSVAKVTQKRLSVDPLTPSNNVPVSGSVYVVLDMPVQGFTADQKKDLLKSLATWLTASTDANNIRLVGGEA